MSYQAEVFNVMIASPGDVKAERAQIREIIHEWNVVHSNSRRIVLLPTGWETHSAPEMGLHPQAIINKQILEKCDLLIGVFWTKIGTATIEYASGTVEEIEKHVDSGKPAMLYFSRQPVVLDTVDENQYRLLKEFKVSCRQRSLYEDYEDLSEFRNKLSRQLQITINENPIFKTDNAVEDSEPTQVINRLPDLSYEASLLLKEAARDSHGRILHIRHLGGTDIQTNGKNFVDSNERRHIAKWESALNELESLQLIKSRGSKGQIFEVTNLGFDLADNIATN